MAAEVATIDDSAISAQTGAFNWVGLNPTQIKGVATIMAASGMFPDSSQAAKAYVKILAGQEMGITPFQAMSDISIIQGKAAAGGNIHATKVKSNPKYDYKVRRWDREGCSIEFFEFNPASKKMESLGLSDFLKQDAQDAGLLSKDMWKKYPRNMYFNRAMTGGVRTYCPDALNGVNAYSPEELGAVVDEEGRVVDYQPERVEERAPAKKPAAKKPSKAETVPEAEVTEPAPADIDKPIIVLIGEELVAKGFDREVDRRNIALTLAGVEKPNDASLEQWAEVLENIKAMNQEELLQLISLEDEPDQAEPASQDTVVTPTDDELENPNIPDNAPAADESPAPAAAEPEAPAPAVTLPKFERGSTDLPRPEMRKLAAELFVKLGLKTKVAQSNFCETAIEKKAPSTFDDYQKLLEILAGEVNAIAPEGDADNG